MIVWVDPGWQTPAVNSDLYKNMLWEEEISIVMFKEAVVAEGFTLPWGTNVSTDDDIRKRVVKLLCELKEPPAALADEDFEEIKEVDTFPTRPVMSGALALFNDAEKAADVWRLYVPYGPICVDSNFTHNQHLRKIKVLNNAEPRASLSRDCDIVGAKWEYRQLKKVMLDTLKHGLKKRAMRKPIDANKVTLIKELKDLDDFHRYYLCRGRA
ncbi:hypothetical protein ZTR_07615 [Talaromyces verruculosus]|nr:hypothetical protein ZTR_07615 [Talaromyces verruculosus]